MGKASINIGYLVTSDVLTQQEHGYARPKNKDSVIRPGTRSLRAWERKLDSSLKRIEKAGRSADAFEGLAFGWGQDDVEGRHPQDATTWCRAAQVACFASHVPVTAKCQVAP